MAALMVRECPECGHALKPKYDARKPVEGVGKNLRKFRERQGYTQQVVADALQCSRAAIANWEANRSQPDFRTLVALARIFKVTPNDLLGVKQRRQHGRLSPQSLFIADPDALA